MTARNHRIRLAATASPAAAKCSSASLPTVQACRARPPAGSPGCSRRRPCGPGTRRPPSRRAPRRSAPPPRSQRVASEDRQVRVEGQQTRSYQRWRGVDGGDGPTHLAARLEQKPRSHDPQAPQPEHRLGVPSRVVPFGACPQRRPDVVHLPDDRVLHGRVPLAGVTSGGDQLEEEIGVSRPRCAPRHPRPAGAGQTVGPARGAGNEAHRPARPTPPAASARPAGRAVDDGFRSKRVIGDDGFGGAERYRAGEHRQSPQHQPLGLGEQAVAPADRRLEVSLPQRNVWTTGWTGTPARPSRPIAMRSGGSERTRAAASSMPSGKPSSLRTTATTAAALPAWSSKPWRASAARATNSWTAGEVAERGNVGKVGVFGGEAEGWKLPGDLARHVEHPTRLVASTARFGHARNKSTARSATASTRCSPLSSTRSTGSSPRRSAIAARVEVVPSTMPSDVATEVSTSSGSASEARSTNQAPPLSSRCHLGRGADGQPRLARSTRPGEGDETAPGEEVVDHGDSASRLRAP